MCCVSTDTVLSHVCMVPCDLVGPKLTDILDNNDANNYLFKRCLQPPRTDSHILRLSYSIFISDLEGGAPACSVVAAISGPSSVVEHRGDCTHLQSAADVLQHLQHLLGVICPHPVHQAIDCCGTVRGTVAQAVRGTFLGAVCVAIRGT